ncbi:MAG: hypothetical protein CMJ19_04425 [Phycisphaeraceae bacterium]|nr:hypothetical protein [Phycisphaeraceae bacterium]
MGETSSSSQLLLQMLMPIVRPDGVAPASRTQNLPLEDQSFEQMLAGLQNQTTAADSSLMAMSDVDSQEEVTAQPSQMLSQLGGLDRIENAALRDMLTRNSEGSTVNMQRD